VESLRVVKPEALPVDVEGPLDASFVVTLEEVVDLPDDLVARMGRLVATVIKSACCFC
jgi:hypothetical protein